MEKAFVSATQEAEVGELLDPRISSSAWSAWRDPMSKTIKNVVDTGLLQNI